MLNNDDNIEKKSGKFSESLCIYIGIHYMIIRYEGIHVQSD